MGTAVAVQLQLPERNVHLHTYVSPHYSVSSLPFHEVFILLKSRNENSAQDSLFPATKCGRGTEQSETRLETRGEEGDRQSEHSKEMAK